MRQPRRILLASALASFSGSLAGQSPARWEWTAAPSVLAPTLTGSFYISGYNIPSQLASPNSGASLYLQARHGDWAFILDGLFLSLDEPVSSNQNNPGGHGGFASGGTQGTQWSVQALALTPIVASLELAFGVAANRVQASFQLDGVAAAGSAGVPFSLSATDRKLWALGVVGARWTPVDAGHWHTTLFGEAGFGSRDSKMWQLVPSVGYRFDAVLEVAAQYRLMHTVYEAGPSWFGYDVRMSSPELAVAFRF